MTLPEELRQASRYTAMDHNRDLLERAAAEIERKDEILLWIAAHAREGLTPKEAP